MVCARDLYRLYLWHAPDGYRDSLALCLLDAVLSSRMDYSAVARLVGAYCRYRSGRGGDAQADGVGELGEAIAELGGPNLWASRLTETHDADLTAAVAYSVHDAVQMFTEFRVLEVADLHRGESSLRGLRRAWRAALGPGSSAAWAYAMRLAHVPDVPADRLLVGYVAEAIGVSPRRLAPTTATRLIGGVAHSLSGNRMHLEHVIWRYQAGRKLLRVTAVEDHGHRASRRKCAHFPGVSGALASARH